jgi:predicted acyltransferase
MSNSIFVSGVAVAVIYLIFRFIEMRFILKENKPLKLLARDTLLVYLSVLLGNFIMVQVGGIDIASKVPQVFTNTPEF